MIGKALLSITTAAVLSTVFSHVDRQYHFVYDRKNMTEALKYCKEKYTGLAAIDSMEDVKILNNMGDLSKMIASDGSYLAWIGMYDDVNSWRWSQTDRSFFKDQETEFRKWWTEEPNNLHSGEHCAQMFDNGYWNDEHCNETFPSVCFNGGGTFILINNSMTWAAAQRNCRARNTDLASVRNEADNQKIKEMISPGQTVWIGLFRDSWKWLDGSDNSFTYWKQGEPNNRIKKETCVAADLGQSSKWEDRPCSETAAFICYSRVVAVKKVMKVKLVTKDSSLDLNDPGVMEDLLKQLKQRLKDKGVTEGVKLSWRKQSDGKVFHKEKKMKSFNVCFHGRCVSFVL